MTEIYRQYDRRVDEPRIHAIESQSLEDALRDAEPETRATLIRELEHADRLNALSRFASGIQHELNNPLTAIVAFGQLIRQSPELPPDLQRDAELLGAEADRTRRLVETLLNYLRPRPPERHPTHLRPLIESVATLVAYDLLRHSIVLTVNVADGVPVVAIDRAQLQQALLDLVANAIEAIASTGAPGAITIEAVEAGGSVRLTVSDDGPGVDPALDARLFDPFVTTRSDRDAAGLGLTIARRVVEGHGGRLSRRTDAPHGDAVFTIELPSTIDGARERTARAVAPRVPGKRSGARVLVLDDEPAIRRFLEKAVRIAGREPVVARSGAEAIDLAADASIGLVITDQRMSDMTGLDVYRAVVARRPDLADRFVLTTGDVESHQLQEFAAEHGTPILGKPFTIDELKAIVGRMSPTEEAQPEA